MLVDPTITADVSIATSTNPVYGTGTEVTLTATPVNGGTSPAYEWYVTPLGGAATLAGTGSSLTYAPADGDEVYAMMTSNATPCLAGSPATSNTVTLTVIPDLPVSVTIAADATTVCAFTPVTFTATPTNEGTTPTYQWKVNDVNDGTDSPSFTYIPADGDIVTCVLTSSASPVSGNPATSNPVTMTVTPRPQFQVTANGLTVTDNHDGTDDVGTLDLCVNSVGYVIVSFTSFTDLQAVTPSNLVKLRRELVSTDNVSIRLWSDGTYKLSDYSSLGSWGRTFDLVNTSLQGTATVRWRTWLDSNNNNIVDNNECAGDWVVYNVILNPGIPEAAGPISGPGTFTEGTSGIVYSISPLAKATSYVWNYSGTGVTIHNSGDANGYSVTLDFAVGATAGDLTVYAQNGCGAGASSTLALTVLKSAEIVSSEIDVPQLETYDLKAYPNPFSERLRFEFVASESVNARIDLYDMTGRLVKTVFDQPVESGVSYQAEFRPDAMVAGMYVYRAVMGEQIYNGKVVFKKK